MQQIRKVFFVLFVYVIVESLCSQPVGSKCRLPVTGKPGICKLITQCPSAIEQKNVGVKIVICSYHYNEAVVCCKDDSLGDRVNTAQTDSFIFPDDNVGLHFHRRSKAEQQCAEYSKLLVHTVQAIPLVTNPEPIIANVPKCDYNSIPLIVGGRPAEAGEFPHMAIIGYRDGGKIEWSCGGTLISERYVLTAAHCINTQRGSPKIVRLGDLNLIRDDDGASPKDFTVENVIKHPDYKPPRKYNDIGLILLSESVDFNRFIRPACLWTKFNINHNKTIATGWGHTEFAGTKSDVLRKVALDIIDSDYCSTFYHENRRHLPRGVESNQMCAGNLHGGKDTCQGDSGGPIQITSHDNQCLFYIVGITSFGKGCGTAMSPAVYTRVSEYIEWLEDIVWP